MKRLSLLTVTWRVLQDTTILPILPRMLVTDGDIQDLVDELEILLRGVIITPRVAIDFRNVEFFLPSGFIALYEFRKLLEAEGKSLIICGMSPEITATCHAFHFERATLHVVDSLDGRTQRPLNVA